MVAGSNGCEGGTRHEEEELVMVDVILAESAGGWFPPIWLLLRLSFSSTGR